MFDPREFALEAQNVDILDSGPSFISVSSCLSHGLPPILEKHNSVMTWSGEGGN